MMTDFCRGLPERRSGPQTQHVAQRQPTKRQRPGLKKVASSDAVAIACRTALGRSSASPHLDPGRHMHENLMRSFAL